ncbi:MAG: molybdopterin-synthase adenylyltransferase MoeB [Rhodospirillales bacterium]
MSMQRAPIDRELSDGEVERYARHLVLPEIDEAGQLRLLSARVLIVGAGGLGAPLIQYLTAAGVGTLGLVDDDLVDLSNLQRQPVHGTPDLGRPKVESAAEAARAINPGVTLELHPLRFTAEIAMDLVARYDLVADGSDNQATRYLINDCCYLAKRPLVSAAVMRFDGQITTFKAFEATDAAGHHGPCYRCLFGNDSGDTRDSCADVGVLGALPGILGSLQAMEVVKELLGIGESLSGRLLLYDALAARFRTLRAAADPDCPLCGTRPTIGSVLPEVDLASVSA